MRCNPRVLRLSGLGQMCAKWWLVQPKGWASVSVWCENLLDGSRRQVVITEQAESLYRFIVYLFAIIGGGFTLFGMVDAVA